MNHHTAVKNNKNEFEDQQLAQLLTPSGPVAPPAPAAETDPIFTASEAALFQPGDKARLDAGTTQAYVDTRSGAYAAGVAALETVRQPSLWHDVLVMARVTILTNQLPCNGQVDAVTDAANPPTTIRGRCRVDISAGYATHGQTLVFVVRKAEYYKLHFSGSGVTATLDAVAEFPINL